VQLANNLAQKPHELFKGVAELFMEEAVDDGITGVDFVCARKPREAGIREALLAVPRRISVVPLQNGCEPAGIRVRTLCGGEPEAIAKIVPNSYIASGQRRECCCDDRRQPGDGHGPPRASQRLNQTHDAFMVHDAAYPGPGRLANSR